MEGKSGMVTRPGAFSLGVANDRSSEHIFVTLAVPRTLHVPHVGPTSIESIGAAAAVIIVPWFIWLGKRFVRQIQQSVRELSAKFKKPEKPESPARGNVWESKGKKLDEFMTKEIAPARERLRKVEDPDTVEKRIEKRNRIKTEQKKKPKGALGLSPQLLQNSRSSLNRAPGTNLDSYLEKEREKEKNKNTSVDEGLNELEGALFDDIRAQYENPVANDGKVEENNNAEERSCVIC